MLNIVAIMGRLVADPELRTTQQGNKRTAVEVVANNISFAGAKAADKPAASSYDQQTKKNHVKQAKSAQNAPQPAYTQGSMDDFSVISDTDDLPF